jgi:hypothetical protein
MTTLNDYCQQVQRFIRDQDQKYINPSDLIIYVNRARREVAERTQCLRFLTPISGQISTISIVNGGTGYVSPVVTISSPDMPSGVSPFPAGTQATATATQTGGVVNNINVVYGGNGYANPSITITDATGPGTGATATASVIQASMTVANQEVYSFSNIDLSQASGYGSVFAVKSVSIIYSNYRYSLPMYDFSTYQSTIRQYPNQYLYVPTMASQRGQGTSGDLYLYPIASQAYPLELDCFCLPQDLVDDTSYEAIPQPWQDAVPYFAAHLCYLELQNLNSGAYFLKLYDEMCHRYSGYARIGRRINPYGRY